MLHSSLPTVDGIGSTVVEMVGESCSPEVSLVLCKFLGKSSQWILRSKWFAGRARSKTNCSDIFWCPPGSTGTTVWCNKGAPECCRVEIVGMMIFPDVSYLSNPQNVCVDQLVEAFKHELWSWKQIWNHTITSVETLNWTSDMRYVEDCSGKGSKVDNLQEISPSLPVIVVMSPWT